jgi:NCAIR mutase (PurE)-related protein
MAITVLGDGCRYCQPQEHIDYLLQQMVYDNIEHDEIQEQLEEQLVELIKVLVRYTQPLRLGIKMLKRTDSPTAKEIANELQMVLNDSLDILDKYRERKVEENDMDKTVFNLDQKSYESFVKALDEPLPEEEKKLLKSLLERPKRWV